MLKFQCRLEKELDGKDEAVEGKNCWTEPKERRMGSLEC